MAKKRKFVDTSNLPRKTNNYIDWEKSIGCRCSFIYGDLSGEVEIVDYRSNGKIGMVTLKYMGNINTIQTSSFIKGTIGKVINKWNVGFKYDIGQIINVRNGNIKILNRYIEKENNRNRKYYDYVCLECNEINCHIREQTFDKKDGCPVCAGRKLVIGKNDIPTTAPWMIDFFQGGFDEAKQYTKCSTKKIYPICPICKKKEEQINFNFRFILLT